MWCVNNKEFPIHVSYKAQTSRTWGPNAHWGPNVLAGKEFTLLKKNGLTLLDGVTAEFLAVFLPLLGPIASLSSTLRMDEFVAKVVNEDGSYTGATAPSDGPTQVAINGKLASGAVMSLHWRAGMESPADNESAVPFLWVIDGTKGSIRMESRIPMGCWVEIVQPDVWVNGHKLEVPQGAPQTAVAWNAFLHGKRYTTIDDVMDVARVIDAVWKSDAEGRRVEIGE